MCILVCEVSNDALGCIAIANEILAIISYFARHFGYVYVVYTTIALFYISINRICQTFQ